MRRKSCVTPLRARMPGLSLPPCLLGHPTTDLCRTPFTSPGRYPRRRRPGTTSCKGKPKASTEAARTFLRFLRNAAIFCSCSAPRLPDELVKTADDIYIRFHGEERWYSPRLHQAAVTAWKDRVEASGAKRAWIYFNNDLAPTHRRTRGGAQSPRQDEAQQNKHQARLTAPNFGEVPRPPFILWRPYLIDAPSLNADCASWCN